MKHVFEFDGKAPQVGGSGHAYGSGIDGLPEYHGCRVDLVICDTNGDGKEGDVLHIESNAETMRQIAQEVLDTVQDIEDSARQHVEEQREHTRQCWQCWKWHDVRWPVHGDGHGNACDWGGEEARRDAQYR